MASRLPPDLLARLAELAPADALDLLRIYDLFDGDTAGTLARMALAEAEAEPALALRWLEIADALNAATGADPSVQATILYAQARQQTMAGDLAAAENSLHAARVRWQTLAIAPAWHAAGWGLPRSSPHRAAMRRPKQPSARRLLSWKRATMPRTNPARLGAYQNLATLLTYQERHGEAIEVNRRVRTALTDLIEVAGDEDERLALLQRAAAWRRPSPCP